MQCGAIFGIGGGKIFDTVKVLVYFMGVSVVIVLTIVFIDVLCSVLSVIYIDEGEFDCYLLLLNNLNMVIVDIKIVAGVFVCLLVVGIGDVLVIWFEVCVCFCSGVIIMAGGKCIQVVLVLVELCYNILLEEGEKVMFVVEQYVVISVLECVIEVNIYLSGVGFESGGLVAVYAVYNGLTVILDVYYYYYGEKVVFGMLMQLVLENVSVEEIETVVVFSYAVGLLIIFV